MGSCACVSDVEDPSALPESVAVRLFLVEGLAFDTLQYFSNVDRNFFRCHYLNVLPYNRSGLGSNYFFGKWSRRVYQSRQQWDIEDRISKGRPWSLNIITDPKDIGLDHDRYDRPSGIQRPCSSLESCRTDKQYVRQAIGECISCFYISVDDGLIGNIIPTRSYNV